MRIILIAMFLLFTSTGCFAAEKVVIKNAKAKDVLEATQNYMITERGAVVKTSKKNSVTMYELINYKTKFSARFANYSREANWYFNVIQEKDNVTLTLSGETVRRSQLNGVKNSKRPVKQETERQILQNIQNTFEADRT